MNIIDKLKLIWKGKTFVEESIKEAKMPTESGTPGYRTTEFYFHLATQIGMLWGAVSGFIPPKYAAIVSVVGASVYNIGRIVAKAVADIQTAKSTSTTVTTSEPVTTITTPA